MFKDMTDEALINTIREGNDEALNYLMSKYKEMVKRLCRPFYIIGAEQDDLIQEGMIGLFKAARDYKDDKGASFSTFARNCVERQLITAVNSSNRQKHAPLNTYISFYENADDENGINTLIDYLEADETTVPEDVMIKKAELEIVKQDIEKRLSKFEKQVLKLYLSGHSYENIANMLDKKEKSIDNAIQRIRNKLQGNRE